MKKYILVIYFVLFQLIVSWGQDSIIHNGYHKFYYPSGIISSEGMLKDGQPDGYWKAYYETGKLKSEGNRKDFQLDGIWKFYNEEEKLILAIHYLNGKKNGSKISYFKDETVEENFLNDVKDGVTKVFWPDGLLKAEVPFVKGMEQGYGKEYARDGTIITLVEYKKGFVVDRLRINRRDNESRKQGRWYYFYPDGKIRQEGFYRDDKKHGFFKDYAGNGDLIAINKYSEDVLIPEAPEIQKLDIINDYYPDGTLRSSSMYRNGTPEGVRQEYNPDGTICKSFIYHNGFVTGEGLIKEDGSRDGIWKEYYQGGAIRAEGLYENGKQSGEWKFYHPGGALEQAGRFNKNGNPEGAWRWYYETGALMREENFRNGIRDGILTEYDEQGNLLEQGEFLDGLEEGPWIETSGDVCMKGSYREGLRHGMWMIYQLERGMERIDSILIFKGNFQDDSPDGKHSHYYDEGRLKEEGVYIMGKKEGDWVRYNPDGTPFIMITFRNGTEIKYDGVRIKPPFEEEPQP